MKAMSILAHLNNIKSKSESSAVAHNCNPRYVGGFRRRITVQSGLGKKITRASLKTYLMQIVLGALFKS